MRIVWPSFKLRSPGSLYSAASAGSMPAGGPAAAAVLLLPPLLLLPPPAATAAAGACARILSLWHCLAWSSNAALKSKASPRSANPSPRKAWRRVAGSSTRNTKFRLLSAAGSTATACVSGVNGHTANSSPVLPSSSRTSAQQPLTRTRSRPSNIWSATLQSPDMCPVEAGRGGIL
ncbi:hypothetical protein COO60DRAFT_1558735 [Scenedesmus sp. NREL 46B-D3]|nr:hypothetical protein COO60DRAFT_1558735 [Scenedesmus sp. NREL 46B-D3]